MCRSKLSNFWGTLSKLIFSSFYIFLSFLTYLGCGGYADNDVGAVSTTGHGESITKVCLAHLVIQNMKQGKLLHRNHFLVILVY